MLRMKLPQRKNKHKASDEEEEALTATVGMCARARHLHDCSTLGEGVKGPHSLRREAVYEWFVQSLGPSDRLEFACGLLDHCNPLELRFLGSCLEDLARKDCHYLRDCESRANGLTGELCEPVSRSRLIVYLALLSSENREVAGRLYHLLMEAERVLGVWEQEAEEQASREELLLLFTMASLHPAFSFHQRVSLRERLEQLRAAMRRKIRPESTIPEYSPNSNNCVADYSICTKNGMRSTSHELQQEAVHIENINIKHFQRRRADKNSEYTFEVKWSDNSKTSVTKSYKELMEFLLTLPKELSIENIDKTILDALHLGKKTEELHCSDLEPIVQQIFSAPSQALLQHRNVYEFFQDIPLESGHPNSHLKSGFKYSKIPEDSSENSSQEDDVVHRMMVHKKPPGKSPISNFVALRNFHNDGLCVEQNGTDLKSKESTEVPHPQHYINGGNQHSTFNKWSFHPASRDTLARSNIVKSEGRSVVQPNGMRRSQNAKTCIVKDPTLDIGSGHETCGETSSESYSSPPSPRNNRRESFESEDEKDRDTDSNSEDSTKPVPSFTFGTTATAKLSDNLRYQEQSTLDGSLKNPSFSHFSLLPTLHCVMPSGTEKMDPGLPPPHVTEGKALGMLVGPVCVSPVREVFHQNPVGIGVPTVATGVGESENCIDVIASPLPAPTTFLPRNCQPSSPAVHVPIQRLKLPTQGPAETCTVNGSTPTGLGCSNGGGFISLHSSGTFGVSSASDPISKQVVSLNQVVPHLEGNSGGMPTTTNLKLVISVPNLSPASSTVPYPLSGPSLATGVLPTANTNMLNSVATAAASQQASGGISQVQSAIPLAVPTRAPGPAPSPSPALTHSTAQSDSSSFISAAVGNASTNGSLLPPQQMGPGACGSCGRRCSCGSSGAIPMGSYYYANPIPGQMYRVPSFFPIPSICNSTYLNQAHQSNGTQFPIFLHQTPYTNALMHDPVLGGQASYSMQQMANFARLYPVYPAANVVGNTNGSVAKKSGNVSCFNCGLAGHYAQDCKQPPMETSQPGTFRLRYAPPPNSSHDSLDSAD